MTIPQPAPSSANVPPTIQIREGGLTHPVILDSAAHRAIRLTDGRQGQFATEGQMLRIRWSESEDARYQFGGGCYVPFVRPPEERQSPAVPKPDAAPAEQVESDSLPINRIAVVTAYYREPRQQIERAIASVKGQSVASDHIVVADGNPQAWVDEANVRHIRLDTSHRDYGNTPRGVGALLAVSEDYDAICFLDADNWLEPDHVERAIATAKRYPGCDYVVARRFLRRPNETILPVPEEPIEQHVDTNCFFFLKGAFHALPQFALIPREMSSIGDRLFYKYIRKLGLVAAIVDRPTVNYHCLWESLYRFAGEPPPPDAKPNVDPAPIDRWLRSLTPTEYRYACLRCGNPFNEHGPEHPYRPVST